MSTLTEDVAAFVALHKRFKANQLNPEEQRAYEVLRARVQSELREQVGGESEPQRRSA